MQRPTTEH
jgi:hypothetical protein